MLAQDDYAVTVQAGGVIIRLAKAPEVVVAPYTVLGFQVADVRATVPRMVERGVTFARYPHFGDAQDADGIWTTPDGGLVAWFHDPHGHLLSIWQEGP